MAVTSDTLPSTTDRSALVRVLNDATDKDLRWAGDGFDCPYCPDHDRSAWIQASGTGHWRSYCFRAKCGVSGDVVDLLARARGCTVQELYRSAAQPGSVAATPAGPDSGDTIARTREGGGGGGGVRPATGPTTPSYIPLAQLKRRIKNFRSFYIYNRGNAPYLGIIRCDDSSGKIGKRYLQCKFGELKGTNGEVIGGWCLGAPSGPFPVYNESVVRGSDEVWVVEGEKCANLLIAAGLCGTTSAGGAGVLSESGEYSWQGRKTDWSLLSGKVVYLWPDNDDVGSSHMDAVGRHLEGLGCTLFRVDPVVAGASGPKWDVGDYLGDSDPRSWPMLLAKVKSEAIRLGDLAVRLGYLDRIISGSMRAIDVPFSSLNETCLPLCPGTLTIIGAKPGEGKSFALLQCMMHWEELGVDYVCLWLEHERYWHLSRLSAMIRRDSNLFNPRWLEDAENNALARSFAVEDASILEGIGRRMVIGYEQSDMTHSDLLAWIGAQARSGRRVICVDPVTALDTKGGKVFELDRDLVMGVKRIASKYNCSILFVSHPRGKVARGAVDIDDIAGGRAYGKFSQCVIWIEQLKKVKEFRVQFSGCLMSDTAELNAVWHVLKVSNGPGARLGIGFNWIKSELRWKEVGAIL